MAEGGGLDAGGPALGVVAGCADHGAAAGGVRSDGQQVAKRRGGRVVEQRGGVRRAGHVDDPEALGVRQAGQRLEPVRAYVVRRRVEQQDDVEREQLPARGGQSGGGLAVQIRGDGEGRVALDEGFEEAVVVGGSAGDDEDADLLCGHNHFRRRCVVVGAELAFERLDAGGVGEVAGRAGHVRQVDGLAPAVAGEADGAAQHLGRAAGGLVGGRQDEGGLDAVVALGAHEGLRAHGQSLDGARRGREAGDGDVARHRRAADADDVDAHAALARLPGRSGQVAAGGVATVGEDDDAGQRLLRRCGPERRPQCAGQVRRGPRCRPVRHGHGGRAARDGQQPARVGGEGHQVDLTARRERAQQRGAVALEHCACDLLSRQRGHCLRAGQPEGGGPPAGQVGRQLGVAHGHAGRAVEQDDDAAGHVAFDVPRDGRRQQYGAERGQRQQPQAAGRPAQPRIGVRALTTVEQQHAAGKCRREDQQDKRHDALRHAGPFEAGVGALGGIGKCH